MDGNVEMAKTIPRRWGKVSDIAYYVRFLRDPIHCLIRLHREVGPVVRFIHQGKLIVFAFGPRYNQEILSNPSVFHVKSITLPGPENSAQRRISNGLVNVNGEAHKRQRRMAMPPLQRKSVEAYTQMMRQQAIAMMDRWRPGQRIDMAEEMYQLALRINSSILFAMDDPETAASVGDKIDRWLRMNTSLGVRLFRHDIYGTPYAAMLRFAGTIEDQIRGLIRQRREKPDAGTDVLSLLTRARDEDGTLLSDDELVGQITILFAGGHETNSKGLLWTLFLLAQHPQVAAALHDELQSAFGNGEIDVQKLMDLPILDRVIRESLRVLPPVTFNVRRAVQDAKLGEMDIPAGSTVLFSHYITHHLPDLFPAPERFDPDRWLTASPSQYEYIPFSAGPRYCVGATFATMSAKVALATIMPRFRFQVVPDTYIDRSVSITLSPRHGMPMTVVPQDGKFTRSYVHGNIHEMVDLR